MIKIMITYLFILSLLFVPGSNGKESTNSVVDPSQFTKVTIQELVSNPKEHNGERVALVGFVDKVEYTESSKGEPFTLFRLNDGTDNEVRVYYEDEHLPLKKGDKVKIQGRYKKQKKYFLYKIKNVIKARTVQKL